MKNLVAVLAAGCSLLTALPVNAASVEYTKICTLYGAGFFYIPGTDRCANPDTGVVKYQTADGTVVTTTETQAQVNQALAGVAISLAMKPATVTQGHKYAVSGNVGSFGGNLAVALSGAFAPNDNVTVNGGVGIATTGDVAAQGGVNFSW